MCAEQRNSNPTKKTKKSREKIKFHRYSLASGTIALHIQHANARLAICRHTIFCAVCTASIYQTVLVSFFVRSIFIPLNFLNCVFFFSCKFGVYVCCIFIPSLSSTSSSSSWSQTHMCVHKRKYMYLVVIRLYYFILLLLHRVLGWFVRALFSSRFFFCFVRSLLILFYFFSSFIRFTLWYYFCRNMWTNAAASYCIVVGGVCCCCGRMYLAFISSRLSLKW